jgi:hypothetical protein
MNTIQLNQDQQNVINLLNSRCKKVELYLNSDNQKEARCLLEDQKVIDVTFYSEDELCVTFDHIECNHENQESMNNYELDNLFIDRMFKTVDDVTKRLDHYCNQTHAQTIREFLK